MSFVPSKLLLWITALAVVPAWLVLGMAGAPLELLLLAGALLLGLAVIDALTSLKKLAGVTVQAQPLVRTSKGKTLDYGVLISDGRRQCRAIRAGLPFPHELETATSELSVMLPDDGKPATAMWHLTALERGAYALNRAFIETPSNLGLWEIRSSCSIQSEVRVYPDLSRERHLLAPLFLRKASLGVHQVRQLGKGREFEQLRAYVPGDSYGDIYWKGTAKRRYPVTMIHQIERTQEIHVVLDISRRSARPLEHASGATDRFAPKTPCERFIQAALVLALAAEQQGDRFGMMTFSDQVHKTLPASSGRAHYDACRDALYTLEPRIVSPDFAELFIQIGNRLRHRSLVIILTDLGEPWLSESFTEAVRQAARRHVVLVHVLGSTEFQPLFHRHDNVQHPDQLYSRLAGHLMWSDLQDTTRELKQCGVHLTSSLQENLIADAVSEYLNVKKRQVL